MKRAPLSWLQAFESTGRTGSFKAAAEELKVSPSTISHQIRDLEAYFGVPLFSRDHRKVTLTDEGRNLLPDLTAGFQSINGAGIGSHVSRCRLHVGAFPFLANEIITPGISELRALLPETEIRIFTHNDNESLTHVSPDERLDVIIRYGPKEGRFPGFNATKIADLSLVPVVGPQVETVPDTDWLLAQHLIRVIGPFQGWQLWQEKYAPSAGSLRFSLETDSYHAAMLAVSRGEGVCLGVQPFVSPWILEGRLLAVAEFELSLENHATYAISARHLKADSAIETLVDWLAKKLR